MDQTCSTRKSQLQLRFPTAIYRTYIYILNSVKSWTWSPYEFQFIALLEEECSEEREFKELPSFSLSASNIDISCVAMFNFPSFSSEHQNISSPDPIKHIPLVLLLYKARNNGTELSSISWTVVRLISKPVSSPVKSIPPFITSFSKLRN